MNERIGPAGAYRPALRFGDRIVVAGMTPRIGSELAATGVVGADLDPVRAAELAGIAADRSLAAASEHLTAGESLLPVTMTVYVSCSRPDLPLSAIADGASLVLERHTGALPVRAAVGVAGLPGGAPVEVSTEFLAVPS